MSLRAAAFAPLILFAVATVGAGDASAQRSRDKARESNREHVDRGAAESGHSNQRPERSADHRALSDAVRRVERRTGGQVLSAERVPYDGRDINRVKVVDSSGRVRVYVDDPPRAAQEIPNRTRRDDN